MSASDSLPFFWSYLPFGHFQDRSVRLLRNDTPTAVLLQARDQVSDTVLAATSTGWRLFSLHYFVKGNRVSKQRLQEILLGELVDEDDVWSVWRFAVV